MRKLLLQRHGDVPQDSPALDLQVAPAEREAVLLAHPSVADAAVIPVADEQAGQIPKAYVVLKGQATAEELTSFVAERGCGIARSTTNSSPR